MTKGGKGKGGAGKRGAGKRGVGKRGIAAFNKKLKAEDMYIEFDENMLPTGKRRNDFKSRVGVLLKVRFPYHIETKDFDESEWEKLWEEVKERWNIEDDKPKDVFLKTCKKNCTTFRSKLVRKYVNTNEWPFKKYHYLNASKWDEFVALKTSDAFLKKSAKAKLSAEANQNHSHLGRGGWTTLYDKFDDIWPQLVRNHPHLKHMHHRKSKLYVASRAIKNKETGLYEVDDELISGLTNAERKKKEAGNHSKGDDDPLTRYLGAEHGGRSRTVSSVIGYTQVKGRFCEEGEEVNVNQKTKRVDTRLGVRGSSCVPDGSSIQNTNIQNICTCELLNPSDLALEQTIAKGQAHPTSDRSVLHTNHIHEGFVKVSVDEVMSGCEKMPLPKEARTDEFIYMEDTINSFIQWPREALKIVNAEAPHKSTSVSRKTQRHDASSQLQSSPQTITYDVGTSTSVYRPEFDEPTAYQVQQQMPSHIHIGSDDFVNSLIEMVDINQSEQPQKRHNYRHLSLKNTREKDQDKQAARINRSLKEIKKRPEAIQHMATRLSSYFCHVDNCPPHPVQFSTPHGMLRYVLTDYIEYEALLQLFVNGWVDITIIHCFEALLYMESKCKSNRCAFFGTNSITGDLCQNEYEEVKSHILDVYSLHSDKQFFLAPYLASDHWSLFIISPKEKEVFIFDSQKGGKHKNSYLLSDIIQDAFGEIEFTWTMVECAQQKQYWECGYMVMKFMTDFVYLLQQDFPENIWHFTEGPEVVKQEYIDRTLKVLIPMLFRELFGNRS